MLVSLLLLGGSFFSKFFSGYDHLGSMNEDHGPKLLNLQDNLGNIRESNKDHLVVLSHGLFGNGQDLDYLYNQLVTKGCNVLQSRVNENLRTLYGIEKGGNLLAEEVLRICKQNKQLRRVSFVGNSLGGLYARYAIRVLYDSSLGYIAGLQPQNFVTIATPHLGVRNFTYLEVPDSLKVLVSSLLFNTGKDLFQTDAEGIETLLYNMAAKSEFITPLEAFQARRMYANLDNDFVVPLGTAACMRPSHVQKLRSKLSKKYGIVASFSSVRQPRGTECIHIGGDDLLDQMIESLDRCGWEKIIVNFQGVLPFAHNKICALSRNPQFITQTVLGFSEGQFVMDHAADFIAASAPL